VTPFLATAYYGFNLANKTLANGSLRQALSMAIDRRRLVESLGFDQVPAYGFVPPGTANYAQQSWNWKTLTDDERIHAAQALYLQAGFSKSRPLRLRVLFNHNEVIERTAVLIAAMWREVLGVETELTAEEFKVFLQSRHDTSRWDLARLAWTADFNDASNFLDVLRTHSLNNDMSYSNQLFDKALDEAAATMNSAVRSDALQSAETLMLKDYPIIPLYYYVSKRLVKPYVHGVAPNPFNHVPSKNLSLEPGDR
jgi:oligopeptide transport system substrate-binding protein